MHTEQNRIKRLDHLIDMMADGDEEVIGDFHQVWTFLDYVRDVLSQSGMSYKGFVVRQEWDNVTMTVKANESGVPLVAFITSATTRGCMRKFLELFERGRLQWHKDKYPWI